MVSRVFTLAGIATFMGALIAAGAAGCTNDDGAPVTNTDAGATDAGPDRFVPVGDDDDEGPPESCVSTHPFDPSVIHYSKAARSPGACSSDEAAALVKYYEEHDLKGLSVASWAATVSETCAACVFTDHDAEEWGPLLVEDDKLVGVNRGGCVEIQSKSEACGSAYETVIACIVTMCFPASAGGSSTCSTQAEFNDCRNEVLTTGACADVYATLEQECGSTNVETYERACNPEGAKVEFEGAITAHCGGTAPDAGADGG